MSVQMAGIAWLAAAGAALATGLFMLRAGVIDRPNARSSHLAPTPRGAGLGIVAGLAAGLIIVEFSTPSEAVMVAGLLICGGLAAALGLADDLFELSEATKFVGLSGLSLMAAALAGPVTQMGVGEAWVVHMPVWIGLLGSALFVFTAANAVNFMDGSDGMLAASLIPASLGLAVMGADSTGLDGAVAGLIGTVTSPAGLLAAALAGFACLNAPIARMRGLVFAGDAGSLGAAMLFSGLALNDAATAPARPWLAALLLAPILVDVLLTMAARAKAGRRLFSAHRAHAYQLLLKLGWTHGEVARAWGLAAVWCGVLAVIAARLPDWAPAAAFVVGITPLVYLHRAVRRRAKDYGIDAYG